MNFIRVLPLAVAGLAIAGVAHAQPKTTNPIPTQCAQMADPGAKDECVHNYKQHDLNQAQGVEQRGVGQGSGQGLNNGTGVGKGQGNGMGVGQGSGQGAAHGTGTGKTIPPGQNK
jgi:hypothetical protein